MKDVFQKFVDLVVAIFQSLGRFIMLFTRYLIPLFLKFLVLHREHLMIYLRKQADATPEKWDNLYTEAIGKLLEFLDAKSKAESGEALSFAKAKIQSVKDIQFRSKLMAAIKREPESEPESVDKPDSK